MALVATTIVSTAMQENSLVSPSSVESARISEPMIRTLSISTESLYSRWRLWFKSQPIISLPTFPESTLLSEFISSSLPSQYENAEKIGFLRLAFAPTPHEMLNIAQLHIITCFLDIIQCTNDAFVLRMLLRDRLLCCVHDTHRMSLQKPEYAGDYFRLLVFYFVLLYTFLDKKDPILAFQLDAHYDGWEDDACTLIVDPMAHLSPQQLLLLLEPLQNCQQRSVLWVMLWLVHTLSMHFRKNSSFEEMTSFDHYLRDALCSLVTIPMESIAIMLKFLPNTSQDFIDNEIRRIAQQNTSFSICTYFTDIVGPVITTEHRYKRLLPQSQPAVSDSFVVLDIRKEVAARNDFVNVVDGCVEAVLYSSISTNQNTRIRYVHVPYSSENNEKSSYIQICAPFSDPIIILSDTETECISYHIELYIANVVSLIFQKASRMYVSTACRDTLSSQHDFPQLLDILLSSDYSTPKTAFTPPKGMLGGWTWWKGWMRGSDNETSSSEYYRSDSGDEKIIMVGEKGDVKVMEKEGGKRGDAKIEESHDKKYFDAIHACLDDLLTEIDTSVVDSIISSHLLHIVRTLLYSHMVSVVNEDDVKHDVNTIEALQTTIRESSTDEINGGCCISGQHLLILTATHLLLICPQFMHCERSKREEEKEEMEKDEMKGEAVHMVRSEEKTKGEDSLKTEMRKYRKTKKSRKTRKVKKNRNILPKETAIIDIVKREDNKETNVKNEPILKVHELDEIQDMDSIDVGDINEMVQVTAIVNSLEKFGSCSVDDIRILSSNNSIENEIYNKISESLNVFQGDDVTSTILSNDNKEIILSNEGLLHDSDVDSTSLSNCNANWMKCETFVVKGTIELGDIQLVNILVPDDVTSKPKDGNNYQIIHIRYGANHSIFLQVDLAIFIVNELMMRIGRLK